MISEYKGAGELAMLLAEMDEFYREQQREKRLAERRELARWLLLDREINQALDLCSELECAALLLAGFHTHKGQWRRDRGRR